VIIDCPNCTRTYCLPPDVLDSATNQTTAGQSLELGWWLSCGYCEYQWWQPAQQSTGLNFPAVMVSDDDLDLSSEDTLPPRSDDRSWMLSLISVLIVVISLGGVGYLYKQPLILFWYQTIEKPVLPLIRPLLLQNVQYTLQESALEGDDSQILTIKGEIVNMNTILLAAPALRISIWADCQGTTTETMSAAGDCLYLEWMFKPNSPQIATMARLPFETSYPVSAKIKRVEVAIP